MKRAFDIVVGSLLAVVAVPVIVTTAIGCAIALRAWPFFVQSRVGANGRGFKIVKIRTLPTTVAPYLPKYELDLESIPRFPRLVRRLHIDELPQLFMVPAGSMSLVGPRPEMKSLADAMPDSFRHTRSAFRPGCTGLWQISVDAHRLIGESPQYDVFYANHARLRLDLWILGRTVWSFLLRQTPITLDDVPLWARRSEPAVERELVFEGVGD